MTCSKLKEILRTNGQNVTGNKQILVARCYALNPVVDGSVDTGSVGVESNPNNADHGTVDTPDPLGISKL